jgi:head-tail adaptor
MNPGNLTERVSFDAPSGTTDAFGGTSEAWTAGDPVPAQWVYSKGDESVQAARQAGRKAFKIKVRSSAATRAVTPDYRMRDVRDGTVWNITEVDARSDEAKRARMVFLVVEGPVVT